MFNAKFRVRVGAVRRPRCMFFICSLWVSGLGLLLGSCLPTHPHLSEERGGAWGSVGQVFSESKCLECAFGSVIGVQRVLLVRCLALRRA